MNQLNTSEGGLFAKEKQQVASNWMLPREILELVTSALSYTSGAALKRVLRDGKLDNYLVTWLSSPEACFAASKVMISFRSPKKAGACLAYAVIKLPKEDKEQSS